MIKFQDIQPADILPEGLRDDDVAQRGAGGHPERPRRLDGIGADARPGEDRLRQDRAGDQIGEGEAEDRQGRHQGIAQRMMAKKSSRANAAGTGRPDIILSQRI